MDLFVSDVHLSARRPDRVDMFVALLTGAARRARSLNLLGDIFDEWLGDDDQRDPHPRVLQALGTLSASGIPLRFVHGNHDFLVGERFCAASGCELVSEPATIVLDGHPALMMHGDALCTRDVEYQQWRRWSRDPTNQRAFMALPFAEREARAAVLRHQSRELTELKANDIMDVSGDAVAETLRAHHARVLIHGHTHRPALHRFTLDGAPALRVVLGDWYAGDSVLVWDESGPRLCRAMEI